MFFFKIVICIINQNFYIFIWFDGNNINEGFMLLKLVIDFNKLCKFNLK